LHFTVYCSKITYGIQKALYLLTVIYKRILHIPNKLTLEILRSFDQRKYPRGHFDPDIFANIFSNFCNFHMYVCETLLEWSLRDISVENILILIKVQPSYDRKCKESWILRTENCEKNDFFLKFSRFFSLNQFKIMKTMLNQTIIICKNTDNYEKLFGEIHLK